MLVSHSCELRDVQVRGRLIDLVAVPFDTPTWVADEGGAYREVFDRAAFRHLYRAADKTQLRFEHRDDLPHWLGRAAELGDDGRYLRATMRVFRGDRGDHLLTLVEDGELRGVSVGFVPGVDVDEVDGDGPLVRRKRVKVLPEISLTESPVYADAEVVAVRAARDRARAELLEWLGRVERSL